MAIGLKNVHLRSKTNTPNGGVDITADEEYQAMLGHEKRIWIFQCKHAKVSDRKKRHFGGSNFVEKISS